MVVEVMLRSYINFDAVATLIMNLVFMVKCQIWYGTLEKWFDISLILACRSALQRMEYSHVYAIII